MVQHKEIDSRLLFRVYQDGRLVAKNSATIAGSISASTATFYRKCISRFIKWMEHSGVKTICHYGSNLRGTIYSKGGCQLVL